MPDYAVELKVADGFRVYIKEAHLEVYGSDQYGYTLSFSGCSGYARRHSFGRSVISHVHRKVDPEAENRKGNQVSDYYIERSRGNAAIVRDVRMSLDKGHYLFINAQGYPMCRIAKENLKALYRGVDIGDETLSYSQAVALARKERRAARAEVVERGSGGSV